MITDDGKIYVSVRDRSGRQTLEGWFQHNMALRAVTHFIFQHEKELCLPPVTAKKTLHVINK